MIMETEIWKDIPWWEWLYQVSNLWGVKSLWYKPYIGCRWRLCKWVKEKLLRQSDDKDWYKWVTLQKKWYIKRYRVHRLIAHAFLWLEIDTDYNAFTSLCVCHKDDNPKNNRLDNLFLADHKYNMKDKMKKWRHKTPKWSEHYCYGKYWALHHNAKMISQYTKEWLHITDHWSIQDAFKATWINNISACCRWKTKTAWWFIWKYKNLPDDSRNI